MRTHGVPPLLTVLLVALFAPSLPANADDPQDFAAQDNRVAIPVSPRERNVMLYEMRELLHGMVNLHGALAKNDPAATALHARTMAPLMDKTPASLKERLPEEFTQLSIAQRESFEAIANASLARKDASRVQHQLAETMTYCSGCHDAFRFEVRKTGSRK